MDNFYNSVQLCERLLDLKTHCIGTLRKDRGEPPEVGGLKPTDLDRGEVVSRHNEKVLVLAWKDKKVVKMVTTLHEDKMETVMVWQKGKKEKQPVEPLDSRHWIHGHGTDGRWAHRHWIHAGWTGRWTCWGWTRGGWTHGCCSQGR